MRRSGKILERPEGSFNRSVFKALGYSDNDLDRPLIGIANSWNELVPGHFNLRQVAEHVRKGIYRAGGTALEFGCIAACDGTAQGHPGMHFILPTRDIIATEIELMVEAHQLDAVVMLGSCDKIIPGMLMAAARLNVPSLILPGGPMLGGAVFDGRKSDLTSMSEGLGLLKSGKVSADEFNDLEEMCGPTCGSCAFLGSANTMSCLAEAIGIGLPDAGLTPAVYAERLRLGEASGLAIVELVRKKITGKQILTEKSLLNAARVLMAIGGSTNGVLHLSAVAHELGIPAERMLALYEKASLETPQVAKVNPASKYDMEDFYKAGGIPQVMREILHLLDQDCLSVTGKSIGENIREHKPRYKPNREVIRTAADPFSQGKGLAILRGNLAPDTGITKPAAIAPEMHVFTGSAICFDCEEDANEAILAGKVKAGDVVVIRYEGPKGGPGMREMYKAMKYIYGMGLATKTALVTDGRFSGTNNGCFVGHVSPEAVEGGPIALVRDGDKISIDIPAGTLHLHVEDAVLAERKAAWKKPKPKFTSGYLALYAKLAASAHEGAVLRVPD